MILNLEHLPRVIPVGIQTESGVEAIGFDVSPWLTRWPDMKITVWPTRPGESAAYIAADTEMVGNVMYWYPNTADTEKEGAGTVEVVGIGVGKRKSSGVIDTLVKKTSLDVTQETPDPFAPWYEAILKAAEDVSADLDAVKAEIPGILLVRIGSGNVSSHTQQAVKDAYYKGKTGKAVLMVDPMGRVFSMTGVKGGVPIFHHTGATRLPADAPSANAMLVYEAKLNADDTFTVSSPDYSTTPNPYPLKMIGAVNATYDGSSAVTVEIPQGGTGGGSAEGACIVNIVIGEPMEEPSMGIFTTQFQVTSADKTLEEVQRALDAGKTAIVRADMNGACMHLPIVLSQPTSLVFSVYSQGQSFGATADESGDWFCGFMKTVNGGGDATEDVFYTADGQVFNDLDGAVFHVRKEME